MALNYDSNETEEEISSIYSQIKSYYESQILLKDLIQKNIQKDIELFLINEKWLDNWKKYSCYNKFKLTLPLKDESNWKEIRQKNEINNGNSSILLNSDINARLDSNFNLVTKECFEIFSKYNKRNKTNVIKLTFESYNKKIIGKYMNKIIVLYINKNNFNLIVFTLEAQDNADNTFDLTNIKQTNMKAFLEQFGIDEKTEKKRINIDNAGFNYNVEFINKSYKKLKDKECKFKNLVSFLKNFDYNSNLLLNQLLNDENKHIMYLINDDSIKQILNYINKNQQGNAEEIKSNNINISEEINSNRAIYNYIKENKTGNIIKFYSSFKLINPDIWEYMQRFFKLRLEIKVYIYYLKNNNILIQYNDKTFEIIEMSNNIINRLLLFCFLSNNNASEAFNEIINLDFDEYLQKNNINILINNKASQDIFDYSNNQNTGVIININEIKNNSDNFIIINCDQFKNDGLNIGLNINNNKTYMNINTNNSLNDNTNSSDNNKQSEINKEKSDLKEINPSTLIIIKRCMECNSKKNKKQNLNINSNKDKNLNNKSNDKEKVLLNNEISNNINKEVKIDKNLDENKANNGNMNFNNNINNILNQNKGFDNKNMNYSNMNYNNMSEINYNNNFIKNINEFNNNYNMNFMNYSNINNNMNYNNNMKYNYNMNNNDINNINNANNNIENNMHNINDQNINNLNNNNINFMNNNNIYNMNNNNIDNNNMNFSNMNNKNMDNNNNNMNNNMVNNNNNMNYSNMNNYNNNNNNMNFNKFNNINNNNSNFNDKNNNNLMNNNNANNFNNGNFSNNNYQFNKQFNNMNNQNYNYQINNNQNQNNYNQNYQINNNIKKSPNQDMNIEAIKSVIQCLSDFKMLSNYFLNPNKYNEYINFHNNFPITSKYVYIINKSIKNPKNFNNDLVKLKHLIEQKYKLILFDPKDIFKCLIESIHKENKIPINNNDNNNYNQIIPTKREEIYSYFLKNKFKPENTTIISNNFFGGKEIVKECLGCKNHAYEYEIFKLIDFQIEEMYKGYMVYKANKLIQQKIKINKISNDILLNKGEKKININELFYYYLYYQKEIKEAFYCNKCGFQNAFTKYNYQFTILPNSLCIALNRELKISIKVEIVEFIDLPVLGQWKKYELIGILSYNAQMNNYFSISKNRLDNQWYLYKDDNISAFNIANVYNYGIPYILFYQEKIWNK